MLLTVDVGNTNTVLGIFDDKELVHSWRVKTDPRSTADELWLQYRALVIVDTFLNLLYFQTAMDLQRC